MTNKTMVNGVDVSECRFLESDFTCNGTNLYTYGATTDEFCKDCKNCYYKQSARKEERIRKLEEKLSQIAQEIQEYREDCGDYEGDDTDGYCYGCQSVYCLAKQIKLIAQGK